MYAGHLIADLGGTVKTTDMGEDEPIKNQVRFMGQMLWRVGVMFRATVHP